MNVPSKMNSRHQITHRCLSFCPFLLLAIVLSVLLLLAIVLSVLLLLSIVLSVLLFLAIVLSVLLLAFVLSVLLLLAIALAVLLLLAIVLSVLLRFTDSDYPFCIVHSNYTFQIPMMNNTHNTAKITL
jgi:hypothetical protein